MPANRTRTAAAAGLLLLPLLTGVAAAAPTSSLVLSVTSSFRAADLPAGTAVVKELSSIGAVTISTPTAAIPAVTRVPGVRGAFPDYAIRPTGKDGGSTSGGVLAPTTIGKAAGKSKSGKGVTVAVIDTGVADTDALSREDGHLRSGPDFSGAAGPRDGFGHGTFMANLIAGGEVEGDGIGVAPGATVIDVKVASANGDTSLSKVLDGLDWVAQNASAQKIRIVSLSLGAPRPTEGYGADPLTDAADAVQAKGVVVVTSAGNDPTQVTNPGQDPQLFTIGAADTRTDDVSVASFSGRGYPANHRKPDVVAAGVRVLSLLPPASELATSYPESKVGDLWRGSGTSQSTAIAAGAVAIFLSGRSGVSPQDVRASFGTAANDLPGGEADGYGLLELPTSVVDGDAELTTEPSGGGAGDPEVTSTSWSRSTSWSSTSWSRSTSWSSTSWSRSTSWSSTSWSRSTSWSSTSWSRSTSWSASSWS
jgi:serine protease AprX